jgi:arylsulfatase A-like enzyme
MTTSGRQARPNIIIVLLDTLRADHLSCYGHSRRTSPCIDRIAEQGALYERAISPAAWTPPAHASLFTGSYPSRHGVDRGSLVLNPELTPLPEALRRHGYRTFGASSNYWLSRETCFDRGFDHFVHSWQVTQTTGTNAPLQRQQRKNDLRLETRNTGLRHFLGNSINSFYEHATQTLRRSFHAYDDGAWRVNRQVKRWVAEWKRAEQPFFAFLHYMEPHIRYSAPGRYRTMHVPAGMDDRRIDQVNQDPWRYLTGHAEMSEEDFTILSALYDGEISYVDHRVGQLYELLQAEGLLRNTVLIITSDHGENLGDHQLMDHAYCLYDTLVHVPLIIHAPGEFPSGQRIGQQVQTLDLFPTLLRLAGVRDGEAVWKQVQGQNLFSSEVRSVAERLALAEYLEPQPALSVLKRRYPGFDGTRYDRTLRMARTSDAKYIWASDGKDELYDFNTDPREERNCIASQPARAAELRTRLEQQLGAFAPTKTKQESVDLDTDMLRRLEQLGYLSS